ncbi:MAG: S9 family peptidase [Colwellia sp.]|nr:S9 family peptidase [Colwellia sp.]
MIYQTKTHPNIRKALLTFTIVLLAFISSTVIATAKNTTTPLLPLSAYGSLPNVSNVQLSPSGNAIAMVKNLNGTLILMVYNLVNGEEKAVLKADNVNVILNWYRWGNDDILLISAASSSQEGTTKYTTTRLYKFDIATEKKLTLLIRHKDAKNEKVAQFQDNIISLMPAQKDIILMAINFEMYSKPSLYEVNIRTGKRSRIKRAKTYIDDWIGDQQGRARISYQAEGTKVSFKLFDIDGEIERDLWTYEVFDKDVVHILGFDLDPNVLYLRALHQDRYAVFKVNLQDKSLTRELIYADDKYDVDGSLIYSPKTGAVVGLSHKGNDDNKIYWDDEYITFKKALNKAIPDADNTIINMSEDQNKYVLYSSSSTRAGDYYLGDRKAKSLEYLASLYPDINESNYATKQLVHYKARDGLAIEGYLTKPINTPKDSKLPAIIFPHGGPMARDYAGFDYWAELFANRGYVVFQPNFRGSSGYGYEFEMTSIEGWGQAMQDDLQDASNWLIKQNIIDPEKVCIAGASYGGYAALMAAVKHGESFKCAASFAGVSDLELIIRDSRRYNDSHAKIVKKQFGSDSDKLESASPINFAKKINIPILLIHGTDDKIVSVKHSRKMADELASYDKEVRYVEIEDANHHLSVQAHRMQTLKEMVNFFDKHLK